MQLTSDVFGDIALISEPQNDGQLAEVAIGDHIVLEPPFDSVLDIGDDIFNVFFCKSMR